MIGSAILREVASIAAARVTTQIAMKANINPRVGLKMTGCPLTKVFFPPDMLSFPEEGDELGGIHSDMCASGAVFVDMASFNIV